MNIPEGILKKEVKTKEQKTKDIEEVGFRYLEILCGLWVLFQHI